MYVYYSVNYLKENLTFSIQHTGLPSKDETKQTIVRNLYC